MNRSLLLARRELGSYSRSPLGYVITAAALLIEGIYFYALALGGGSRLSAEVLARFFEGAAGTTMIVSVVLSMKLFAGERETGTLVMLSTSPLSEREIVAGKFLAGFAFIAMMTALTVYMPALIFVNGKVSVGHIAVGYAGILLIGAASLAGGLFASSLASSQVVAAIVGAAVLGILFLIFFVAPFTDPPIKDVLNGLSIFHVRQRSFMTGVLKLENVVFNLAVAYFFLLATTKTLEARRWR
jgi:ABC-2 type transport system permease protein